MDQLLKKESNMRKRFEQKLILGQIPVEKTIISHKSKMQ
jgi:hypothetical protein